MTERPTFEDVLNAVRFGSYTNDQLNAVMEAVKYARNQLSRKNIWTFQEGDQVSYINRKGVRVSGVIKHIAVKKCHVQVGTVVWTVPANMLTKL